MIDSIITAMKEYIEYIVGSTGLITGYYLNISSSLPFNHIAEKVIDGFIGIVFLCIGVIATHFLKKWLNRNK